MITNITFPSNTISAYWFQESVAMKKLNIADNFINAIQPYAFETLACGTLSDLILNMPLEVLRNGTFNGLSLLSLTLHRVRLHTVETGVMCLTTRINYLEIEHSIISNKQMSNMLGCLSEDIESISIKHHSSLNKIRKVLLSKFNKIRSLTWDASGITDIEGHSFDSFGESLNYLSLIENSLKTLADDLFPRKFFMRPHLDDRSIFLTANPWHCSCRLSYLKKILSQYSSVFSVIPVCASPLHFRTQFISQVDLCDTNTCSFNYELIPSPITVKSIKLDAISNNSLILILNDNFNNYNLIWFEKPLFEMSKNIQSTKCIAPKMKVLEINNIAGKLESNKIYTFCLLEKQETMMHPIDCVTHHTYLSQNYQTIWLKQDMKITIIALFFFGCCLVCVISIIIAVAFGRIVYEKKEMYNGAVNTHGKFQW